MGDDLHCDNTALFCGIHVGKRSIRMNLGAEHFVDLQWHQRNKEARHSHLGDTDSGKHEKRQHLHTRNEEGKRTGASDLSRFLNAGESPVMSMEPIG